MHTESGHVSHPGRLDTPLHLGRLTTTRNPPTTPLPSSAFTPPSNRIHRAISPLFMPYQFDHRRPRTPHIQHLNRFVAHPENT